MMKNVVTWWTHRHVLLFALLQGCGVEGTLPPSSPRLLVYGITYVQGAVILLLK